LEYIKHKLLSIPFTASYGVAWDSQMCYP